MIVVPSLTSNGAAGVVAVSSVQREVGGSGGSKGKPGRFGINLGDGIPALNVAEYCRASCRYPIGCLFLNRTRRGGETSYHMMEMEEW
jgi:hypothetical protein